MKKMIALLLCLCLAGCAAPIPEPTEPAPGLTADEIARVVVESQPKTEGFSALPEEEVSDRLELSWSLAEPWEDAAIYAAGGMDGREIAVVLLSGEADVKAGAECLETYRASRRGDFVGYAPEEAALLQNAAVLTQGRYLVLLACEDVEGAKAALEKALSGEWTPAPTPEPSAVAAMDITGFPPFTPPNETDMTLYDLDPLRAAWKAEDPSGLSEKDAAVYEKCRELFAELISPEMTGVEKELALHDWLVDHGEYDKTSYETAAHVGRADNRNPYGMLIGGYGICLGYAVTFQLLMDFAGVECVTVVGASAGSTGDHAWNMVKLDGEWYCVDATWNATSFSGLSQRNLWVMRRRYFNVTSQEMRDSDHQWDYEAVPEATATRYRWDGLGPLPK